MSQVVLQTEKLTKKYRRRVVVDRLSMEVERGDIFGFLGQNGAGKSTTIRIALGLVRPTSGRVRVLGYDMSRQPLRALKRIGAIIEAPAFYENFSGRQNLRMLAAMSGGAERQRIDVDEMLRCLNLQLHQIDQVSSAGDKFGGRLSTKCASRGNAARLFVTERFHVRLPSATSRIAATILG